jgi:hypothetical protein
VDRSCGPFFVPVGACWPIFDRSGGAAHVRPRSGPCMHGPADRYMYRSGPARHIRSLCASCAVTPPLTPGCFRPTRASKRFTPRSSPTSSAPR